MTRHRTSPPGRVDDLRASYDPDDDDVVREQVARAQRRPAGPEPPPLHPPAPVRADEVLCRSCHLYVRREFVGDATLLICRDCRR